MEVTVTHQGPVALAEPASGHAFAFRYTATAEPNRTFEALLPMLRAASADELVASMRLWVDPVNNFVFADVHGTIGYKTRGRIPVRAMANAWVPVPGWDGAHEWQGAIPFEEMPAVRNPEAGWVATANSRVTAPPYPHYIGLDFAPDFRTRRLVERLGGIHNATVGEMAMIHADRVSLPAREFVGILKAIAPVDHASRPALEARLAGAGGMDPASRGPPTYTAFRERLMRDLMAPILGPLTAEAFPGSVRGAVAHIARLRARLTDMIRRDDRTLLAPDADWPTVLRSALAGGVAGDRRAPPPRPAAGRRRPVKP